MTSPAQAQQPPQGERDFTIPPPTTAPAPRTETGPPRTEATAPRTEASPFSGLQRGATTTEIALGIGVLVVLAVVFLFVRGSVRAHLIGRRAALDAANGAAWALFSALMLTATVLVTAALGDLWQYGLGLGAALALCAVLFAVSAVLFVRAPQRRR